jgi:hypothetical protein
MKKYGFPIYEDCGTYAALQRHVKEGTPVCKPCREAGNEYMRNRRHQLGESKGTWVYVPDPPVLTADDYVI